MLLVLGLLCLGGAWAGDFDNALRGEPVINKCTLDTIIVDFNFEEDFDGVLFTLDKDDNDKKTCLKTSTKGDFTIGTNIWVSFSNDTGCLISKEHVVDPDCKVNPDDSSKTGQCLVTAYTITVYLRFWRPASHEPGVHTKIDKAFTFACIPQPGSDVHDTFLQVVDVEPEVFVSNFTVAPDCGYCLSDISPLGTPDLTPSSDSCLSPDSAVSFQQKVFHEIHCAPNDHWRGAYCLEVEECRASYLDLEGGDPATELDNKNSVLLIENDCTQDSKLISDFAYSGNTWAFAESHPFHVGHPNGDDSSGTVDVYFYCLLSYYPSDKTDQCEPTDCESATAGRRRKRSPRSAASRTMLKQRQRFTRSSLPSQVVTLS